MMAYGVKAMAKSKQVESAAGVEDLTDEQIAALEAENEREKAAYEERRRANDEKIAQAKKARAGKVLDGVLATIEANKANWGSAEIARLTKALGAVAGTGARGRPAGSTNSKDIIERYAVPAGTFNPRGLMPTRAAEWFRSPEGQAHFEQLAQHRPDFDVLLDSNGVPRRGYPLNRDFVEHKNKKIPYEPSRAVNKTEYNQWLRAEAKEPKEQPAVNVQAPVETPIPTPHPTPTPSTTPNKK